MHTSKRFVSTTIASAFNKLHVSNTFRDLPFLQRLSETGLFGHPQLSDPSGFYVLKENAITQSKLLVDKALSETRNEKIVQIVDEISNCLCKVADLAAFVHAGHPISKYKAAAEDASVEISCEVEKLNTNKKLYDALKCVAKNGDIVPTTPLDEYVTELFLSDFEQNGIHLPENTRQVVLSLNEYIMQLSSFFMSNSLGPRSYSQKLLPPEIRLAFPIKQGNAIIENLNSHSENRLLRETAYRIYLSPDEAQENALTELIFSRKKLASLCGFNSFAERAVRMSIAATPNNVWQFLTTLSHHIKPLASKDYDTMLRLKHKESHEDKNLDLQMWDVPYYSALFRESTFSSSVTSCAAYFSLGSCMEGVNLICDKVFGIQLEVSAPQSGELWSEEVVKLAAVDKSTNDVLGYIYCDFTERANKLQHDCHFTIQGGCQLKDSYQIPIVVVSLNLPHSVTSPTLLTPQMVNNLFHEMGHALHSIIARTPYQHITGTRCSTDLAEVPSVLMEKFASDPRVVKLFARHHFTGEPIPDSLLHSWIESNKLFSASDTQLQVFYAILDQAYHGEDPLFGMSSTTEVLKAIQDQYYGLKYVEGTAWQLRFGHLANYGAKYYSYLISQAVVRLIWRKLFERNPLSSEAGKIYKKEVLSHGGGKPPKDIVENVLQESVSPESLALSLAKSLGDK